MTTYFDQPIRLDVEYEYDVDEDVFLARVTETALGKKRALVYRHADFREVQSWAQAYAEYRRSSMEDASRRVLDNIGKWRTQSEGDY